MKRRLWSKNGTLICKILWLTKCSLYLLSQILAKFVYFLIEKIFYEDINKPTFVRGAFFVAYNSLETIDFYVQIPFQLQVLDPRQNVVFSRTDRTEVVFFFNATELGEYSFVFSNERKAARKSITIAIDIVTPFETIATPEDLNQSDLSMKKA